MPSSSTTTTAAAPSPTEGPPGGALEAIGLSCAHSTTPPVGVMVDHHISQGIALMESCLAYHHQHHQQQEHHDSTATVVEKNSPLDMNPVAGGGIGMTNRLMTSDVCHQLPLSPHESPLLIHPPLSLTALISDKRVTFRQRRLSLPLHSSDIASMADDSSERPEEETSAVAAPSFDDEGSESALNSSNHSRAQTFRKRRLSLTQNRAESGVLGAVVGTEMSGKRRRRASEASTGSVTSASSSATASLRVKTVHAGELLRQNQPPPSPAFFPNNVLYQQAGLVLTSQQLIQKQKQNGFSPPPLSLTAAALMDRGVGTGFENGRLQPKWTTRHTVETPEDEHKLPFPRQVVGTYSCHGVEPWYDGSGSFDDDDDEDEVDSWGEATAISGPTSLSLPSAHKTVKLQSVAKINQDRGGIAFPYGNSRRTALFAVYDGHGLGGEHISQFALHEVQRRLFKHESFKTDLGKAFKETFLAVDEALKQEVLIEPLFAGTTACVALYRGNVLTVANVGDSRAVLGKRMVNGEWAAIDLSEDQNPDMPREKHRIILSGGYVSPSPGPGLSSRVWLDPGFTQIGLAMSRSIGDHALAAVGVIAEPVVTTHKVEDGDEFMILASDGLWEFISSHQAVRIVGQHIHRGATKATQALIEAAAARWYEEEGEYRDDITAIVVSLQGLWESVGRKKSMTTVECS